MSLFNETLLWFMKRRMPRIEAMYERPLELQEQMLQGLLSHGRSTEWGAKHGYADISNYEKFKQQVPISTYEEIFPYIDRMMQGEQNILWDTPISWYSKSSGTTNARSKFIPVSKESLEECHMMGGKDMITLLIQNKPETKVFEGKGLSIGGSLTSHSMNSSMLMGDVSAVVMKNLPIWAQMIRTPSLDVALMGDWDQKIEKMALETSQENVTSILGVPTWTLVLIEKILELTGKQSILEVWPNFEFLVHGAVAFGPYRELFQTHIFPSSEVRFLEIYNASEGFFGIQDDLNRPDEMLLMLDYGIFYEFIPMGEKGALRLTTALYYTPSGKSIQGTGIEPDIKVDQPLPEELQGKVRTEGESSLPGHIKGQNESEEGSGSVAYVPPEAKDDVQLNYALDLLRGVKNDPAFPADPQKASLQ